MKELLEKYFDIQKQIYEAIGFKEFWKIFPIDIEAINCEWFEYPNKIFYNNEGEWYSSPFYFGNGNQNIYKNKEVTAIITDTQTDGNIILQFFSNDKRIEPIQDVIEND